MPSVRIRVDRVRCSDLGVLPGSAASRKEKIPCPIMKYTSFEIASRGESIYRYQIRDKMNPEQKGKYLVIDVESRE